MRELTKKELADLGKVDPVILEPDAPELQRCTICGELVYMGTGASGFRAYTVRAQGKKYLSTRTRAHFPTWCDFRKEMRIQTNRFLVATGSWLERPEIRAAIGDEPNQWPLVVTTPYGFHASPDDIRRRAIVYVNPFVHSSAPSGPDDFYPAPADLQAEPFKVQWDPNNPDHYGYGYQFTQAWARTFGAAVGRFLVSSQPAGILLDDWHPSHRWWRITPEEWGYIHQGTEAERLAWLQEIEHMVHGIAALRHPQARILTNGVPRIARSRRYWEGVFAPWRPAEVPRRYGLAGDFLYAFTGVRDDWLAVLDLAEELDMVPGWGFPDGKSLVDGVGALRIERPDSLDAERRRRLEVQEDLVDLAKGEGKK